MFYVVDEFLSGRPRGRDENCIVGCSGHGAILVSTVAPGKAQFVVMTGIHFIRWHKVRLRYTGSDWERWFSAQRGSV